MQTVRVLLVDAFTDEPLAGNPAGVVPDAAGLNEAQRQAIASELSVSETAFLTDSDVADYRLQYFTPTQSVDLCGHATLGAFAGLAATGDVAPGGGSSSGALGSAEDDAPRDAWAESAPGYSEPDSETGSRIEEPQTVDVETPVGVVEVTVEPDGSVWMTHDEHSVRRVDLDRGRLADALGVTPSALTDLADELPLAVASTGLRWLLVPIAFLSQLGEADPDPAAVEEIADELDAVGIYPYTFDTLAGDAHLHARAFAPGAGVPEDPVTGTAAGAVGAFLRHVGAFDDDLPEELIVEQGHYVDRPGRARVRTTGTIAVGGDATVSLEGELTVPEREAEEILEA